MPQPPWWSMEASGPSLRTLARKRRRGVGVVTSFALAVLVSVLNVSTAHEAVALTTALSAAAPAWTLEALRPGERVELVGVAHVTVFAAQAWDLEVDARLANPSGEAASSQVSYRVTGLSDGDGVPASLVGQQPTGPDGRSFRIDLQVTPSWNDPPETPLLAHVETTLSAGAVLATSHVVPSRRPPTYAGTTAFWFTAHPGLEVGSGVRIRVVDPAEAPVVTLTGQIAEGTWQRLDWTSPDGPTFAPGVYAYTVETAAGERIAAGSFIVDADDGGMLPASMPAGAATGAEPHAVTPASGAAPQHPQYMADVRIQVDPANAAPGEGANWHVRLFNPGVLSVVESSLVVCLPQGWRVQSAEVPILSVQGRPDCARLALGALPGRKQTQVYFTTLQWPPGQTSLFRNLLEPTMDLYLYGLSSYQGEPALLRSERVPLIPPAGGVRGGVVVTGWAFVDENRNGVRDPGERPLAGAEVVVDGMVVRTVNRDGSFTVRLQPGAHVIWARTPAGATGAVPVWVHDHAVGGVFLPFVPSPDVDREAVSLSSLYVGAGLVGDARGITSRYHVRGARGGEWGHVALGLAGPRLGAPVGLHPNGESGAAPVESQDVHATLLGEGHRVVFDWRSGTLERARFGPLRTSMPAQSAWSAGLIVPDHPVEGVHGTAYLGASAEVAHALGDYWDCDVLRLGASWNAATYGLTAETVRAAHRRYDERGLRSEVAGLHSLQQWGHFKDREGSTGIYSLGTYSLGAYWGVPRRLSPSCGYTPKAGFHWTAAMAPADEQAWGAVSLAGSHWPSGARTLEIAAAGPRYRIAREGHADALELRVRPVLQWHGEAGAETTIQGVAFESRLGRHRLDLQLGPRPLTQSDTIGQVARGEGRYYLRWSRQGDVLSPWIAYERYPVDGVVRHEGEFGLSARAVHAQGAPWGPVRSVSEVKRVLGVTAFRDQFRFDASVGRATLRVRIDGKQPRDAADPRAHLTGYRESQATASLSTRLGAQEWTFSIGRAWAEDASSHDGGARVEGGWSAGGVHGEWRTSLHWRDEQKGEVLTQGLTFGTRLTCACGRWRLGVEMDHVLRETTPFGLKSSLPSLAALALHGARPLAPGWAIVGEARWAGVSDAPDTVAVRATVSAGFEWTPAAHKVPLTVGFGVRAPAFSQPAAADGAQWYVQFGALNHTHQGGDPSEERETSD